MMTTRSARLMLTSEEILVYSAGHHLPLPPGVVGNVGLDIEDPDPQVLFLATRALASRGIAASGDADGNAGPPEEELLSIVCGGGARFLVSVGTPQLVTTVDFAIGDDRAVAHAWNLVGVHLLEEYERSGVLENLLTFVKGDAAEDRPAPLEGATFEVGSAELLPALDKDDLTAQSLLEQAAPAGFPAASMVKAISGGSPAGVALFHGSRGDDAVDFGQSWFDLDEDGLWTIDPPSDDRPTIRFEATTMARIQARLTDAFRDVMALAAASR